MRANGRKGTAVFEEHKEYDANYYEHPARHIGWVADINGRRFVAHRNPGATGYDTVIEYAADAMIASLARPAASIRVSELLPPAPAETA